MHAKTRVHHAALLSVSLIAATSAFSVAATVPAHATALSAEVDCESSSSQFYCTALTTGGTPPYAYSWRAVTNAWIIGAANRATAHGGCSISRGFSTLQVTVTDATGASLGGSSTFICQEVGTQ